MSSLGEELKAAAALEAAPKNESIYREIDALRTTEARLKNIRNSLRMSPSTERHDENTDSPPGLSMREFSAKNVRALEEAEGSIRATLESPEHADILARKGIVTTEDLVKAHPDTDESREYKTAAENFSELVVLPDTYLRTTLEELGVSFDGDFSYDAAERGIRERLRGVRKDIEGKEKETPEGRRIEAAAGTLESSLPGMMVEEGRYGVFELKVGGLSLTWFFDDKGDIRFNLDNNQYAYPSNSRLPFPLYHPGRSEFSNLRDREGGDFALKTLSRAYELNLAKLLSDKVLRRGTPDGIPNDLVRDEILAKVKAFVEAKSLFEEMEPRIEKEKPDIGYGLSSREEMLAALPGRAHEIEQKKLETLQRKTEIAQIEAKIPAGAMVAIRIEREFKLVNVDTENEIKNLRERAKILDTSLQALESQLDLHPRGAETYEKSAWTDEHARLQGKITAIKTKLAETDPGWGLPNKERSEHKTRSREVERIERQLGSLDTDLKAKTPSYPFPSGILSSGELKDFAGKKEDVFARVYKRIQETMDKKTPSPELQQMSIRFKKLLDRARLPTSNLDD